MLDHNKNPNPNPKTGQLDNRDSQFYLAMYWAHKLAAPIEDKALAVKFAVLANTLTGNEEKIVAEMAEVQGKPVGTGGITRWMRPSGALNRTLEAVAG